MRCNCGGELRATTLEHLSRWAEGPKVLVTDVPAWRCERCGMVQLDDGAARRLEDLVRAGAGQEIAIVTAPFAGEEAPLPRGAAAEGVSPVRPVYLPPTEHVEQALEAMQALRRHWLTRPTDREQELLGDQIVGDLFQLRTLLSRAGGAEAQGHGD